ncbi:hypothetical protein [Algoriphagus mannitolivorans]|uniref:hypothetical protein n=1 Tax=Algoriphagus mannitolivorans TaxID=226504 RepID=UPI0003FD7239|nr:hypothetical protein [Algoriphagus mannitolivorans]
MQEDNLDKWLASSLRKAQEESPVPYKEGAWESFEKKRYASKPTAWTYWISGIAASLVLLIGYSLIRFTPTGQEGSVPALTSTELLSEEKAPSSQERDANSFEAKDFNAQSSEPLGQEKPSFSGSGIPAQSSPSSRKTTARKSNLTPALAAGDSEASRSNSSTSKSNLAVISTENEKSKVELQNPPSSANNTATDAENQAKLEALKKQIADLTGVQEEKVESNQSNMAMTLGLNPGFGTGTQNNQNVTGSSIGLGVQMNLALSEKVSVGSGMGLNYFSQTSKGPGMVAFANAAYPTNERTEIDQVQVDLPLYITYPLTRNKGISIQAGFSNILAFNQTAQQETMYVRQVTVQDASTSLSSVSFRNENVTGLSSLDAPNARFLPFATANLGVNFRLLESKKTSYLLMPFYNYPLQDISGTGNNIGFFGASLKVNFGTLPKK